ncbi:hypothetical protein FZM99_00365 [Enterococcus faecium]|nr:hypothetical protein [Enterococcus faecium]
MVHSDSDLILHNSSVLIDKEPKNIKRDCDKTFVTIPFTNKRYSKASFSVLSQIYTKMWKAISQNFS